MRFFANHKQDFCIALLAAVIMGSVTLTLISFGLPRLALGASIINLAIVGERMHRLRRYSKQGLLRFTSTIVMLIAWMQVFAVGIWSVGATP